MDAVVRVAAVLCCAGTAAAAASTASVATSISSDGGVGDSKAPADWWVRLGSTTCRAPAAATGLSRDLADYRYVLGSKAAVLEAAGEENYFCGEGRWHVLHLPEGSASLALIEGHRAGRGRRASFSALGRLRHGLVLSTTFPEYNLSEGYENPLDLHGRALEVQAVAKLESIGAGDSGALAKRYLEKLTDFYTRSYSNDTASGIVEHWLKDQFEELGLATCFQVFDSSEKDGLVNVIARMPGQVEESVTVGAHYDSRPFTGRAPGAEDNGSGVAVMLAVAAAFKASGIIPNRTVYFVGFAGEEADLLGSKAFVDALQAQALPSCQGGDGPVGSLTMLGTAAQSGSGEGSRLLRDSAGARAQRVALHHHEPGAAFVEGRRRSLRERRSENVSNTAIIMDEVGWKSPALSQLTVNLESYDRVRPLMDHLKDSSNTHNGMTLAVVHNGQPFGSDHMSWLDQDMPAVLTINGDDEAYPDYHKSTDRIDNVNKDLMGKVARMNLGALVRLAGYTTR